LIALFLLTAQYVSHPEEVRKARQRIRIDGLAHRNSRPKVFVGQWIAEISRSSDSRSAGDRVDRWLCICTLAGEQVRRWRID
jgi:hypothetical protein